MTKKKQPKKRKRLVRGKDWHVWAFKLHRTGKFSTSAYDVIDNPPDDDVDASNGEWVRVKFVEVE